MTKSEHLQECIEEIKDLYYNQFKTQEEVSKHFNCSCQLIRHTMTKHKLSVRHGGENKNKLNKHLQEHLEEIKDLYYSQNKIILEIAKSYKHKSISSIYNFLKKNNVKARLTKPHFKYNLIVENIKKLYFEEKKTQREIAHIYGCSEGNISDFMAKNNLKVRSRHDRYNQKSGTYKKYKSYKEIYGNKAQLETKKRSESHKLKWSNINYKKKKIKEMREALEIRPNKPETILINLIEEKGLPFRYVGDGKFWIVDEQGLAFNPDFVSEELKCIIEVFGDYWHNIEKYKIRDVVRINAYTLKGYRTLVIWEHELKEPINIINKLKQFMEVEING